jgi:hypothetical protein
MTPRNKPKNLVYHIRSSFTSREAILEKPNISSYYQIFTSELTIQQANHDTYFKIERATRPISVKCRGNLLPSPPSTTRSNTLDLTKLRIWKLLCCWVFPVVCSFTTNITKLSGFTFRCRDISCLNTTLLRFIVICHSYLIVILLYYLCALHATVKAVTFDESICGGGGACTS